MADRDFIIATDTKQITFAFEPAAIVSHALGLLGAGLTTSGLSDWIYETSRSFSPIDFERANLSSGILYGGRSRFEYRKTFPQLLKQIQDEDATALRNMAIKWMREHDKYPGDEVFLTDVDAFIKFQTDVYTQKGHMPEVYDWEYQFKALSNADFFKSEVMTFLNEIWKTSLKANWEKYEAELKASVDAFSKIDMADMDMFDAIEYVTGRDMRDNDKLHDEKTQRRSVFIPTPHIGPYVGWMDAGKDEVYVFYGVRMPASYNQTVSRSELLVSLNALSDDTRLQILDMLVNNDELCAQDFITELNLSQSSASRHLRQLTASGYIVERRREIAKCYSLNPERVESTIDALRNFLRKK